MNPLDRYKEISVLGAAGKMGSGILLLNVLHSSMMMHRPEYEGQQFIIHAIDKSFEQLNGLNLYLKAQIQKWAERHIIWLRKAYVNRPHLIDNKDVIETFVFEAMSLVKPSVNIESAYHSRLIFEAIVEVEEHKVRIFEQIKLHNPHSPWFLTNTSSIPIHVIDQKAHLHGNIIGCHFYNPPAVQKLIEVIETKGANPDLTKLVYGFGKYMDKILVPSNDIAGFIGNGFFMRDVLYAEKLVNKLLDEMSFSQAIYVVDAITRDLLIRPMGIFQLVDYVGLDVCRFIMSVMDDHQNEPFTCSLLNDLLLKGLRGGQNADGSQKDGIFIYEKGVVKQVFDSHEADYVECKDIIDYANEYLSVKTKGFTWKQLSRSKYAKRHLSEYFISLFAETTTGAILARNYLVEMNKIAHHLVDTGVTDSTEHVNTVMKNGFFHLYGPDNDYI